MKIQECTEQVEDCFAETESFQNVICKNLDTCTLVAIFIYEVIGYLDYLLEYGES